MGYQVKYIKCHKMWCKNSNNPTLSRRKKYANH